MGLADDYDKFYQEHENEWDKPQPGEDAVAGVYIGITALAVLVGLMYLISCLLSK